MGHLSDPIILLFSLILLFLTQTNSKISLLLYLAISLIITVSNGKYFTKWVEMNISKSYNLVGIFVAMV